MIGIIDYGVGNLSSIKNMLNKLGLNSIITNDKVKILECSQLILPGVGNFKHAMKCIKFNDLISVLNFAVLDEKKPILGICLGAQLMTKHSEEGDEKGFGWLNAKVVKFSINETKRLRIPHMGWNYVDFKRETNLISSKDSIKRRYYFVHSYHFSTTVDEIILGETNYGYNFPVILAKDNMYAVQFHPEKSHKFGMELLKGFSSL